MLQFMDAFIIENAPIAVPLTLDALPTRIMSRTIEKSE